MKTIEQKAHDVAQILNQEEFTPRVVAFDPATIAMLVSILTQLAKLVRWWKPEWFVNWQIDRIIQSHLAENTTYAGSVQTIRRAIAKSNEQNPLDQVSLW